MTLPAFVGFTSVEDVLSTFKEKDLGNKEIIVAALAGDGGFEENAYVLLKDAEGNLFEVEAGHCSCFGFEGLFQPAPITREYLQQLTDSGAMRYGCKADAKPFIIEFLSK